MINEKKSVYIYKYINIYNVVPSLCTLLGTKFGNNAYQCFY